jgi:Bacterial regulatory helix-turn-helix protein, lysR family
VIGRGIGAHVPALDAKTIVELLDRDRLGLIGVFLGLSAAVQRLEANLGLRLIERTTRHLRLTDADDTI